MKRLGFWVVVGLLVAGSLSSGSLAQAQTKDEKAIRALEDRYAAAFRAKDVEAIMKAYAPGNDLVVFDVVIPRQYVGFDAYMKDWEDFFATVPGPIEQFEITDLSITTDGKLGYSHSIQHIVATGKDGTKMDFTTRVTDCYRKIGGKWLITHEHMSVPIDLASGKPDLTSKP